MKKYRYLEPERDYHGRLIEPYAKVITEEEILERHWKQWSKEMYKKYGKGHSIITKKNCINDWIIRNWAWEIEE